MIKKLSKITTLLLIFAATLGWGGSLDAAESYDLKKCYELAVHYADSVKISEQEIAVARAQFNQALGDVLPVVTFRASEFLQDSSASGTPDTVQQTFTRFSTPGASVNVTQPLFQGLKEYTALKLSKVNTQRAEFALQNTRRLLFQDVTVAFFTIATIERDIEDTELIIGVVGKRIVEMKKRIFLGKSREGELTQEESLYALLQGDLAKKTGQKKVAYEMMSFLTGVQPMPPIDYKNPLPRHEQVVNFYLDHAQYRPDVIAAAKDVTLAKGEVKIARGDLLPSIVGDFNYYAVRPGFQSGIHWDATIDAEVPVFNWANVGRLREAQSRAKQSEFAYENTNRVAATEIRRAYVNFKSAEATYEKYRTAVTLSYKNFLLQNKDFNIGLADNLDVLTAQQTWLNSLDQRNLTEVQSWLAWVNLQIVSGILP